MGERGQERRKKFFVKNASYQKKVVIVFTFLFMISFVFLGALIYVRALTSVYDDTVEAIKFVLPIFFIAGAFLVVLIGIIALLQSHRIAGATYHIENDIHKLMAGNLKVKFNIRKDDELHSLVTTLNKLSSVLNARISEIKTAYWDMKIMIEETEKKNGTAFPHDVKVRLQAIENAISKFDT